MGNLLLCASRRKIESTTYKDGKTSKSKKKKKKTSNRIKLTKTKNKLKPVASDNKLFAPRDMQSQEQQTANQIDDNFGLTPLTPREIDVNRFQTSKSRQNSLSIENENEKVQKVTNTAQQPQHSPGNNKRQKHATFGTFNEQDSQVVSIQVFLRDL